VPKKSYKVTRTLMITYVPTDIQDPEIIIKHFHEAYPGCVVTRVHFCYDVRMLIELDDQRRHAMRGRLYYTAKAKKSGKVMIKTHPCSRLCFCKCWTCFKEVPGPGKQGTRQRRGWGTGSPALSGARYPRAPFRSALVL